MAEMVSLVTVSASGLDEPKLNPPEPSPDMKLLNCPREVNVANSMNTDKNKTLRTDVIFLAPQDLLENVQSPGRW